MRGAGAMKYVLVSEPPVASDVMLLVGASLDPGK